MIPKEKAKQLVENMFNVDLKCDNEAMCMLYPHAIKCALISVENIVEALDANQWQNRNVIDFYTQVKHEIEKL
jgi:hypothetical protein